jgi:5'-3' exonuclease
VLRGITTSSPTLVCLQHVIDGLSLSMDSFVDMCILSGSDFTPKPKGFGPATSYKVIKGSSEPLGSLVRSGHKAFSKWTDEDREMFLHAYSDAFAKFRGPASPGE